MKDLVIIGAGGFGRETLDVVEAINRVEPTWNFLGFIDDSEPNASLLERRSVAWLGNRSALENFSGSDFVVGISNPKFRSELVDVATLAGLNPAILVHPSVHFGSEVEIGSGTILCAGVSLTTNIKLGQHVQINPGVLIGHDSTLEDFVSVYPGAVIGGNVCVESNATIGANVTVLQGKTIGQQAMVGAGSVVTKNVAESSTVKGVPAR